MEPPGKFQRWCWNRLVLRICLEVVCFIWCVPILWVDVLPLTSTVLGEVEFLDVWNEAYSAVMNYTRGVDGYWVRFLNSFLVVPV